VRLVGNGDTHARISIVTVFISLSLRSKVGSVKCKYKSLAKKTVTNALFVYM
jgi:hypothetical protein